MGKQKQATTVNMTSVTWALHSQVGPAFAGMWRKEMPSLWSTRCAILAASWVLKSCQAQQLLHVRQCPCPQWVQCLRKHHPCHRWLPHIPVDVALEHMHAPQKKFSLLLCCEMMDLLVAWIAGVG